MSSAGLAKGCEADNAKLAYFIEAHVGSIVCSYYICYYVLPLLPLESYRIFSVGHGRHFMMFVLLVACMMVTRCVTAVTLTCYTRCQAKSKFKSQTTMAGNEIGIGPTPNN